MSTLERALADQTAANTQLGQEAAGLRAELGEVRQALAGQEAALEAERKQAATQAAALEELRGQYRAALAALETSKVGMGQRNGGWGGGGKEVGFAAGFDMTCWGRRASCRRYAPGAECNVAAGEQRPGG